MNSYYFFVSVGIVIALLPFIGVPQVFKDTLFTFAGLLIVFVAQKFIKKHVVSTVVDEVTKTDTTMGESTSNIS